MKSKKLAALFLIVSLASGPASAWGWMLPYAEPAWAVLKAVALDLLKSIGTHPNDRPKHL